MSKSTNSSPNFEVSDPNWRLGVDIGGTFTDFVLINSTNGQIYTEKRLTSQDDPARSVLEGIDVLLTSAGVSVANVGNFVHGTTLAINAVIGGVLGDDRLVIRSLDNCSTTIFERDTAGNLSLVQGGHEADTLIR